MGSIGHKQTNIKSVLEVLITTSVAYRALKWQSRVNSRPMTMHPNVLSQQVESSKDGGQTTGKKESRCGHVATFLAAECQDRLSYEARSFFLA